MTNLEIIEAMVELDNKLAERYNASMVLVGYGDYLGTYNTWSKESQYNLTKINDPKVLEYYFSKIETVQADYFDIAFSN